LGFVDFLLLLLWWLYLYLFFVIPWQYVLPDEGRYGSSYNRLVVMEEMVTIVVLAVLCYRSSERWRRFYAYFLGAQVLSTVSDYLANRAIDQHIYYTGSWYELPYASSLALFTVVALVGFGLPPARESSTTKESPFGVARLAMIAVLSLPVMAVWVILEHGAPPEVAHFRSLVTLGTIFVMAFLVFIKQHRLGNELSRINNALHEASLTDPLTGIRNRRFFDATIEADVGQALRSHADERDQRTRDLVFYLIDLDDFKGVNDRFGHDAGDKLLVEMARRISSAIRNSDVLVRWGGEEFLVVSRYTDRGEAEILAARVLAAVANTPFIVRPSGEAVHQTCSIGWAAFPWLPEHPRAVRHQEVLSLADHGLYQAKQSGKNRSVGVLPSGGQVPVALRTTAHKVATDRFPVQTLATSGPQLP
jgi:diguanylate cyclase (GGDEF)-like protein